MTNDRRNEALGVDLWAAVSAAYAELFALDGSARTCMWQTDDGWLIGYTTERIVGGPHHGRFATLAYKPLGKGSRSGRPESWVRVYFRGFAKRKTARQRATVLYTRHSPTAGGER